MTASRFGWVCGDLGKELGLHSGLDAVRDGSLRDRASSSFFLEGGNLSDITAVFGKEEATSLRSGRALLGATGHAVVCTSLCSDTVTGGLTDATVPGNLS